MNKHVPDRTGDLMMFFKKRKRVRLSLLAITVSMSLLATLFLTGVLEWPIAISETVTLEVIRWEFRRPEFEMPHMYVSIAEKVEALYDYILWVNPKIRVGTYVGDASGWLSSEIAMSVELNSTTTNPNVLLESVCIILRKDNRSIVEWQESLTSLGNLLLVSSSEGSPRDRELHVDLRSLNRSKGVFLSAPVMWSTMPPSNQTHQLDVSFEPVYYNGTVYKKVIQPFQLKFVVNEGNASERFARSRGCITKVSLSIAPNMS